MSECPKCGSQRICGPKYTTNPGYPYARQEALIYTCLQCGYQVLTPTKDAGRKLVDCDYEDVDTMTARLDKP